MSGSPRGGRAVSGSQGLSHAPARSWVAWEQLGTAPDMGIVNFPKDGYGLRPSAHWWRQDQAWSREPGSYTASGWLVKFRFLEVRVVYSGP